MAVFQATNIRRNALRLLRPTVCAISNPDSTSCHPGYSLLAVCCLIRFNQEKIEMGNGKKEGNVPISNKTDRHHPHAVAFRFVRGNQLTAGLAPARVRPCRAHKSNPTASPQGLCEANHQAKAYLLCLPTSIFNLANSLSSALMASKFLEASAGER